MVANVIYVRICYSLERISDLWNKNYRTRNTDQLYCIMGILSKTTKLTNTMGPCVYNKLRKHITKASSFIVSRLAYNVGSLGKHFTISVY